MLISKTMTNAINEQIGNEFAASLQYVAIASRFDADALSVLAGHFYRQAGEERDHAMRFIGPLLLEQLKNRFVEADRRILLAAQPVDALAPRGDERPRHQRAVRLELRPLCHRLEGDVLENVLSRVRIPDHQPSRCRHTVTLPHQPFQNVLFS
jgi:hypothetical protein